VSYDIELDNIEVEDNKKTRDNMRALTDSLEKIREILNDIDERLKTGGL